jgi:hypothetical protein
MSQGRELASGRLKHWQRGSDALPMLMSANERMVVPKGINYWEEPWLEHDELGVMQHLLLGIP